VAVLRHHRDLALNAVERIPGLACISPQATYLVWIDCRSTRVTDPEAACLAAGIGPSDGAAFGSPGFIRLNTACPTPLFEEILRRLALAFPG
jgi:cystathionine beta-lyase